MIKGELTFMFTGLGLVTGIKDWFENVGLELVLTTGLGSDVGDGNVVDDDEDNVGGSIFNFSLTLLGVEVFKVFLKWEVEVFELFGIGSGRRDSKLLDGESPSSLTPLVKLDFESV